MEKEQVDLVKEEISQHLTDARQEMFEMNSEILLIFDEFKEILKKFEKRHKSKIVLEDIGFYQNSLGEIQDWQSLTSELIQNPSVENYMDFGDKLETYMDFMVEDVNLISSCMSQKSNQDMIEYQYAQLSTFVKKNKIFLDSIDKIIENIASIKE